jgi:hypothetical protein
MWCIPPKHNAEFVYHMENVLEAYKRPYDSRFPLICMDELSKQLTIETQTPLPAARGRRECFDYEYERNGTANVFAFTEPLTGWRHLVVTDQRTKTDWAEAIRQLVDVHHPKAERITLVMDNLNTHSLGSLYEAFPPQEARRLIQRLEVVKTPQAWQLAQHGRNRIECSDATMSCPANSRQTNAYERNRRLGERTKRQTGQDRLAIQNR